MQRRFLSILVLLITSSFFLVGSSFVANSSFMTGSFKEEQLKYSRVRQAYKDSGEEMVRLLHEKDLSTDGLSIYLRAFKAEKKIELWGRNEARGTNEADQDYQLIKTYKICSTSGVPGPKRKQGDLQIPEGYYHIDRFNPYSNFYLSLGINYPNRSDRILGVKGRLGGDIFIHGDCVTIGCLPITDAEIKELYIFCVEARDGGQTTIPVTIFPTELTETKFQSLVAGYEDDEDRVGLWTDLKKGYDLFNETRQLPTIGFLDSGRHRVE